MGTVNPKGGFSAALTGRQWIAPEILEFRLRRPAGFDFIPGQFVRFDMGGYQREYTMISKQGDATIDFCIDVKEPGHFSSAIQAADIGAIFKIIGPLGHFIHQGTTARPAVFVATGTGVAPFVAFCRTGVRGALLLHGVGDPGRLIYRQVLRDGVQSYVACISREFAGAGGDHFPGRVTRYLESQLPPGTYDFYLCGGRAMIRDAVAIIDRRFDGSRLFVEAYND